MASALGLVELNRSDPNQLADCLRNLHGPEMGIGDYLNLIATKLNLLSTSGAASRNVTVAGAAALDVYKVTVAGNLVTHQMSTGDAVSATTAALALLTAINADPIVGALVLATQVAGVITLTAKRKGTGGNAYTLSSSVVGTGTCVSAGALFTGCTGADDMLLISAA